MTGGSELQAINHLALSHPTTMDVTSPLTMPVPGRPLTARLSFNQLTLALVLIALAVRIIGLELRPLWLDEAYSAWFSSRSWHELWTKVPTYEPHPPFYYSLLKCWRLAVGGTPLALRSFSVILGAATVPLAIAASVELERLQPTGWPRLRAGIAGLLAACSPMLVFLGQEARPYPLLTFAYGLAIVGIFRLMREFAAGPGKWSSWLMVAAGTELGLWAHGLGLLYASCIAAALLPAWLKRPVGRQRLIRGGICAIGVAAFYLPCLLMIVNRAGDWGGNGWLSWKPEMMLQLISLYTVPVDVLTISSAVAALVMILLAKRSIAQAIAGDGWNGERALLLMWWGPPILAALISQFAIPVFLARALAPTLVPAYLLLAGGLARVKSPAERTLFAAALSITLLPATFATAVRPAAEQWNDVRTYLDRNVHPGDQIWLYPNDSALPLGAAGVSHRMRGIPGDYPATGYKGPIRAGSPAVVSLTAPQAQRLAADPSNRNIPIVWLVSRQSQLFDPAGDLNAALSRQRRKGTPAIWGYIEVQPYYRR